MHVNPTSTQQVSPAQNAKKVIIAVVCSLVVYQTGLVPNMLSSEKTWKWALYPAYALYVVFCVMWVYTSTYLQRKDLRWFQSHETFLKTATAIVTLASVLWMVGLFPVYHLWIVPLFFAVITLVANVVGLMPGYHVKAA